MTWRFGIAYTGIRQGLRAFSSIISIDTITPSLGRSSCQVTPSPFVTECTPEVLKGIKSVEDQQEGVPVRKFGSFWPSTDNGAQSKPSSLGAEFWRLTLVRHLLDLDFTWRWDVHARMMSLPEHCLDCSTRKNCLWRRRFFTKKGCNQGSSGP
jgi:hypothetical protein